ncbi:MAG: hypothetical protein FWC50_15925 [Planctomycetaceae bacterium]|nr:hypothetical protein [Planctomycetaceae bacterium]
MYYFRQSFYFTLIAVLILATGCDIMPVRRFRPTLHNPFPQLREIAVVPFVNRSGNPRINGRETAELYANQLQRIPGFHVTPVATVQRVMVDNELTRFDSVDDIRKLAELLQVDAVVIGTINEYSGYQPPKFGLEVEVYAANPYFHPIPAGYGLPWGTPAEKEIPDKVILQAEQELAYSQLKTQTPNPKQMERQKQRGTQKVESEVRSNDLTNGEYGEYQPSLNRINPQNTPFVPFVPGQNFPGGDPALPPSLPNLPNGTTNGLPTLQETKSETGIQLANAYNTYYAHYPPNNSIDWTNGDQISGQADARTPQELLYEQQQETTFDELTHRAQGIFSRPFDGSSQSPNSQRYPETTWRRQSSSTQRKTFAKQESDNNQNRPRATSRTMPAVPMTTVPIIQGELPPIPNHLAVMPGMPVGPGLIAGEPETFPGLPKDWPDSRGLIPDGPQAELPQDFEPSDEPVMRHIAVYNGNDADFTRRLADYEFLFIDDRHIDGWQGMLRRRSDFISVCCCMHIWEMLSCRGGAGKAERVCHTPKNWYNP